MTVEFRLPILADVGFLSNVKLAALSLAQLGGRYASAPLHISVGGATTVNALRQADSWASRFPIRWHMVTSDLRWQEFASGMHRYAFAASSDVIVLMDADACLVRPIDELLETLARSPRPTVAGMSAHCSPFPELAIAEEKWRTLLATVGFSDTPLEHEYSLVPPPVAGRCPPYFNYGFIAFNAPAFEIIRPLIPHYTKLLLSLLAGKREALFSAQLALTCAILETGADTIALDGRYNCPNSDEMIQHGLVDINDIRVMHFLRTDDMDRHTFLCEKEAFAQFQEADFASLTLQQFRKHVLSFADVFYGDS